MKKQSLLLGAHISIAGGMYKAFARGTEIGCTAIQIFTKSNRRWDAKQLTKDEIMLFKEAQKNQDVIKSVVIHAGYLINIGSPKKDIFEKSRKSLKEELERAEQLGIPSLVFHPGNRQDMPEEESINQIAETAEEILESVPGKATLVFETMAGQGSSVASTLEQIGAILDKIKNKKRIGVCVDTCHIFSAGYDIRTPKAYESFWQNFDKTIGIDKLKVMHLNDSKKEFGSKADRHDFIGKGKLGLEAFKLIMNDPQLFDIPKILETPVANEAEYEPDLKLLRSLMTDKTKKLLYL